MESMVRPVSGGNTVAKTEKVRVQFDFAPDALERLDALIKESGATTRAEVVRNPLSLYEWFITEVKPDDTIRVYSPEEKIKSSFKAKLLR